MSSFKYDIIERNNLIIYMQLNVKNEWNYI